tara:strand:+ start:79 stop:351 length:273 start_codon:yes stop_codon:yes gene_type:complete
VKYYISKVDVRKGDGKKGEPAIVATERILTKPAPYKAAKEALRRYTNIGITNISICEHKTARYRKLMKAQRKKTKPVTIQDIAEALNESE